MNTKLKLPLLESLCWNIAEPYELSDREMLALYQRYWRWQDILAKASREEAQFIINLTEKYQSYPLIKTNDMDKEKQYRAVSSILTLLNAKLLQDCRAYLGGGVLNNLEMPYYRYSADIDFICSSTEGYRQLRRELRPDPNALFDSLPPQIKLTQTPSIDRYGIRFPILVEDIAIKFEIILKTELILMTPYSSIAPPFPA